MNLIAALGAYCFFDNKPEAIQGCCIEDTKQLSNRSNLIPNCRIMDYSGGDGGTSREFSLLLLRLMQVP